MTDGEIEWEDVHPDGDDGAPVDEPEQSQASLRRRVGLGAIAVGLLVALSACACGALGTVGLASPDLSSGLVGAQSLRVAFLVVQFGLVLAAGGVVIWRGWFSSAFHPRRMWPLLVVFLLLLSMGCLLSFVGAEVGFLSRIVNGLTMLTLPLLVLAAVGRSLRGTGGTWRDVIGGLVGGGAVGTSLALLTEAGLAVVAWIAISVLGLLPGGQDFLRGILDRVSQPESLADPQTLLQLLDPAILTLALVGVTVVAPAIEEVAKTLVVGLAGRWLRPTPARAFLLGVASGAGFAVAENLLNSTLVGSLGTLAVLSRTAATFMHCAVSGLVGWGWGEFWRERRLGQLVLALAAAIGLHGLWNGLAFGMAVTGLLVAANQSMDIRALIGPGLMILVLGLGLLFLVIVAPVGMLLASRALAGQAEEE